MRIIDGKTMTCKMCDTTFEYKNNEVFNVPGYPCMGMLVCPKCKQQIIMIADDFKPAKEQIIVEENNENNKKTS